MVVAIPVLSDIMYSHSELDAKDDFEGDGFFDLAFEEGTLEGWVEHSEETAGLIFGTKDE